MAVSPADGGLRVRLEFGAPVREVAFARTENVRRDAWQVVAGGLSLEGGVLRGARAVTKVELLVLPDPEEHDRVFPSLTRVGGGLALYGPALLVSGYQARLEVEPGPGAIAWPERDALAGYLYVGPAREVSERGGLRVIGGDSVPRWLADAISEEAVTALATYQEALGRAVDAPALIVTDDAPGPMPLHADVTDNAIVFLRFHGPTWAEPDAGRAREIARLVRHEIFHLWNRSPRPGTPPWLHEGGAEYAAIVAAVQSKVLSEEQGVEQVSFHLARCRRALGERSMTELERGGPAVYHCGVTLQWLADLQARRESGGARSTFSLWSELLARADGGGYSVEDFRARAGSLVAQLFDQAPGAGRWARLSRALEGYGVVVSHRAQAGELRAALVQHLLAQHCGDQPRGFWTHDRSVRLDTGSRCGLLSGDPEITAVEGHEVIRDAAAAFEAAARRCRAARPVRLRRATGGDLAVPCDRPLERPEGFQLEAAPPLAL